LLLAVSLAGPALAATDPVQGVTVRAVAHFNFDSATIQAADRESLLAEVGRMKDVTWQSITATGYTDSVGPTAYNAALARKRARAVRDYLAGKGLPTALMRTHAKGQAEPVADNATDEGRARNRRTEVLFTGVRASAR
jgi:OOP family OmpA-OmpF porin